MVKLATVREYWETRSPGLTHSQREVGSEAFFDEIEAQRYGDHFKYRYLEKVAEFDNHPGERVLEIGVGLGTDILQFARGGSKVYGIDLAKRAIELATERFRQKGQSGVFLQASFTAIPFKDTFFDLVYSFGVLHHSKETQEGVDEIFRVLKPGGRAIVMLYHKGFKYYVRKLFLYGVLGGEFLQYSAQEIVNRHSEVFGFSPLTKVYSRNDAARLFRQFDDICLSCYRLDDYVKVGGRIVSPTQLLLPSRAYRWVEDRFGWNLIIKARKPLG